MASGLLRPPADLLAVVGYTLLTLGIVLHPVFQDTLIRVVVGLPFVLFVPGYVFVAALFPGANTGSEELGQSDLASGVTGIGRVALSFGVSMVVVSLVGSVLNYTPFGLREVPILVSLSGLVLGLTFVATWRRHTLSPRDRFVVPWRSWLAGMWTELMEPNSRGDAALNVLLVASVLVAAASVGYAVTVPKQGESSTELYLLTENDSSELVDEYPSTLVAGEPLSLVVGVENHEQRPIDYTILVKLDQVRTQNGSTQIVRSERLQDFEKRVEHDGTWRRNHTVTPRITGERLRLTYLLYRGDPPTNPTTENAYRKVQLWINVTSRN